MNGSTLSRVTFASIMLVSVACNGTTEPGAEVNPGSPRFARVVKATTPVVSSTSPTYAEQGETNKLVTINGSGFAQSVEIAWERSGMVAAAITVHSVTVRSSSRIDAVISVSGDAEAVLYDVAVTNVYPASRKKGIGTEMFEVRTTGSTTTDPNSTWMIPLADGGLAFRSDGAYSDGTYSVYAHGVCNVDSWIHATTQKSNNGDAIMQTNAPGKGKSCGRSFRLHYPDGFTETVRSFNNLRTRQNTTTIIPVGSTVRRQLILNPGVFGASRCGRLLFGIGDSGNGVGSDSVLITRVSARSWEVRSNGDANLAWCQNTGELFVMPISFVVLAARDLPES